MHSMDAGLPPRAAAPPLWQPPPPPGSLPGKRVLVWAAGTANLLCPAIIATPVEVLRAGTTLLADAYERGLEAVRYLVPAPGTPAVVYLRRQELKPIASKEELDLYFRVEVPKCRHVLPPLEATEYMRRIGESCKSASALFDADVVAVWPGAPPLAERAPLDAAPFGAAVGMAPAAEADAKRAGAAARAARAAAMRSSGRPRKPRSAAAAAAERIRNVAEQADADNALPPEELQPAVEQPARPRSRSGSKRRPDGAASEPKRRRGSGSAGGSPVPGTPAPEGSAAAAASARAREAALARETARAIKAAQDELRSMPAGSVRLVLTIENKRPSAAAVAAAAAARQAKPRDRTHEKSFQKHEQARLERLAQKRAAQEAAAREREAQRAVELALALRAASDIAPPEAAAAQPADAAMPDAEPTLFSTPPAAPAGRLLPILDSLPLPPPPPLLPANPQRAAETFALQRREGLELTLPSLKVEDVRALLQGAIAKGTAEHLYSDPSLQAVPPFQVTPDGQEMPADWVVETCGIIEPQLPSPVPPALPALPPPALPPPPPPVRDSAPAFAFPMSAELARARFNQMLQGAVPQPSQHLLKGLVPPGPEAAATASQQSNMDAQRLDSAGPSGASGDSPQQPAGPASPPLPGAPPKVALASASPASPELRSRRRPPPLQPEEYVRVRLIVNEAGRVGVDGAAAAAKPVPAAPAAAVGTKRPRQRRPESAAVASAIAPPLLLEIAARRAAPSGEDVSSAVALYLTEARNACSDPLCHTQPTLWADVGTNTPAALLRGADPAFWGALRGQGALMLRAGGVWDTARKRSALMDVSWLTGGTTRLRTMGSEYQYIRQTLPASNGFVEVYEDYLPADVVNGDYPFGALVEDIQESFRFAAESFRLLGVPERERYFLAQMRAGLRLQFPYLQGVALNALNGRAVQGCLRATPAAGAHAWDPSGLPVCEGSILPGLLRQCEACCNPLLVTPGAAPAAAEGAAPAPAVPDARPSSPPRPPRDAEADRAAEVEATGAAAMGRDAVALAHQMQRRLAGQHALRAASSRRSRSGAPVRKRKDKEASAAAEEPAAAAADEGAAAADAGAGAAPPAAAGAAAAEAAAAASMSKLWGAGIVTPWLYYMGVCSTFAAHFEDYSFGSANVIVAPPDTQAWVIWYSVPRESLAVFHAFLRDLLKEEYTLDCLEGRRLWIDPRLVAEWNARQPAGSPTCPVYRHVQGPGEYVVTDYGSVHWGVNLGVGWKAAVNFAFEDWRAAAEQVDAVYAQLERDTGQQRHYRCAPDFGGERCRGAFDDDKLASFALRREAAAGDAPPLPQLAPLAEREAAGAEVFAAAMAAAREGKLDPPPPPERPAKAPRLARQPKEQPPQPPRADESMPAAAEVAPPVVAGAQPRSPAPAPRAASPPPLAGRLLTPDLPRLPAVGEAPAAAFAHLPQRAPSQPTALFTRAVTPDLPSADMLERSTFRSS